MKQGTILVFKHGRPSMKKVFSALNKPDLNLILKSTRLNKYVVRDNTKNLKQRKFLGLNDKLLFDNKILIRWGNYIDVDIQNGITYNKAESVKMVNSKGQCRKILEKANVAIPKTYLTGKEITAAMQNGLKFPIIGRPEKHGQGRHFFVCNNNQDIKNAIAKGCSYFSEFYNKTREFRVHCGHGKILAIVEKPAPKDDKPQWNRAQNDEAFVQVPWGQWDKDICLVALNACKAMGVDFAGVDVMAFPKDKTLPKAVVVELNCAPTLTSSPHTMDKYVKYFNWLLSSDKKRPHWDYTKFKKVTSLAWKDNQFAPDFNPTNAIEE